jgi:steroid delta-isomerase-like uncharacterized protein
LEDSCLSEGVVAMMTKEDIERLDDQGIAAWNDHDAEAWAALFADDAVLIDWTNPEQMRGKDGARGLFGAWVGAFPDMKVEVVSRVVGDDGIAAEVRFSGTNTGSMNMGGMEVPPTNKAVTARGAYIARFQGGTITEFRALPDAAGMMMQLGFMPQM